MNRESSGAAETIGLFVGVGLAILIMAIFGAIGGFVLLLVILLAAGVAGIVAGALDE